MQIRLFVSGLFIFGLLTAQFSVFFIFSDSFFAVALSMGVLAILLLLSSSVCCVDSAFSHVINAAGAGLVFI